MFGYVKTYQPELKMGEFEQYRGVYCSLCKALGKRYGLWSRMTLSYDFTFLALFHMGLTPGCCGFEKSRCTFNPLKKCLHSQNNADIDRAADAAMLLVYYKLKDSVADDGFFKRLSAKLTLTLFANRAHRKAVAQLPETDKILADCMAHQMQLEKEGCPSIDKAADPTATMLSVLASMTATDDDQEATLQQFGYALGRWVYLIDALDDLEDDLKEGQYNPYIHAKQLTAGDDTALQEVKNYATQTLNACAAMCLEYYENLTIHRFEGILRNVLQYGMPYQQKRVVNGEDKNGKQ